MESGWREEAETGSTSTLTGRLTSWLKLSVWDGAASIPPSPPGFAADDNLREQYPSETLKMPRIDSVRHAAGPALARIRTNSPSHLARTITRQQKGEIGEMPYWVLNCPHCRKDFNHSEIDGGKKHFGLCALPAKPEFPEGGSWLECLNCKQTSLFQRFQLTYSRDRS